MSLSINDLINRRGDLSTFLVHLTRDGDQTSSQNLKSILESTTIRAKSVFGHLKNRLVAKGLDIPSQKAVCFTETPLEYTHLLTEDISDRDYKFGPYGIALTKRVGREGGINPVWYVDMSPGHDWITNNLDNLADRFISEGCGDSDLEALFPFIEHMGNGLKQGGAWRKEFWWEREWRHVGDFTLPRTVICLCPEAEIADFKAIMDRKWIKGACIDPRWSLEKIIAHLAGFKMDQIDIIRGP